MGTISEKLTYLNGTKQELKQKINNLGGSIDDNTTFRNYANQLQNVYDNLPKTEYQTGTEINLGKTIKGKLDYDNGVVGIGQSSQESTQGNQLVNFSNLTTSGTSTTVTFSNNKLTVSNTSGTYNSANIELVNLIKANPNKVLKFVYSAIDLTNTKTNGDTSNVIQIKMVDNGTTTYNYLVRKNGTTSTFTIPSDTTNITSAMLTIHSNNTNTSQSGSIVVTEPMLQFGTDTKDYEQYTGGQASPNPSYPQEIEVVRGKNLLSSDIEQNGIDNATGQNVNSNDQYRTADYINIAPNTQYTLSINGTAQQYVVYFYDSNKNFIRYVGASTGSFTTPSNAEFIRFRNYVSDYRSDFASLKIQLEERKCSYSILTI